MARSFAIIALIFLAGSSFGIEDASVYTAGFSHNKVHTFDNRTFELSNTDFNTNGIVALSVVDEFVAYAHSSPASDKDLRMVDNVVLVVNHGKNLINYYTIVPRIDGDTSPIQVDITRPDGTVITNYNQGTTSLTQNTVGVRILSSTTAAISVLTSTNSLTFVFQTSNHGNGDGIGFLDWGVVAIHGDAGFTGVLAKV